MGSAGHGGASSFPNGKDALDVGQECPADDKGRSLSPQLQEPRANLGSSVWVKSTADTAVAHGHWVRFLFVI